MARIPRFSYNVPRLERVLELPKLQCRTLPITSHPPFVNGREAVSVS